MNIDNDLQRTVLFESAIRNIPFNKFQFFSLSGWTGKKRKCNDEINITGHLNLMLSRLLFKRRRFESKLTRKSPLARLKDNRFKTFFSTLKNICVSLLKLLPFIMLWPLKQFSERNKLLSLA